MGRQPPEAPRTLPPATPLRSARGHLRPGTAAATRSLALTRSHVSVQPKGDLLGAGRCLAELQKEENCNRRSETVAEMPESLSTQLPASRGASTSACGLIRTAPAPGPTSETRLQVDTTVLTGRQHQHRSAVPPGGWFGEAGRVKSPCLKPPKLQDEVHQ